MSPYSFAVPIVPLFKVLFQVGTPYHNTTQARGVIVVQDFLFCIALNHTRRIPPRFNSYHVDSEPFHLWLTVSVSYHLHREVVAELHWSNTTTCVRARRDKAPERTID